MTVRKHTEIRELARKDILQYLSREPKRLISVGPISRWLRGGYSLERTEELLEGLVTEGILRHATDEELRNSSFGVGYYLREEAKELLPPEDRSYGII